MSTYTETVKHLLRGLHYVSPGACPGCDECGLETKPCRTCDGCGTLEDELGHVEWPCPDCYGKGDTEPSEEDVDAANEGGFSWHACDACGSTFGGSRHPAHGFIKRDGQPDMLCHINICEDCLLYLANGDEPENWSSAP